MCIILCLTIAAHFLSYKVSHQVCAEYEQDAPTHSKPYVPTRVCSQCLRALWAWCAIQVGVLVYGDPPKRWVSFGFPLNKTRKKRVQSKKKKKRHTQLLRVASEGSFFHQIVTAQRSSQGPSSLCVPVDVLWQRGFRAFEKRSDDGSRSSFRGLSFSDCCCLDLHWNALNY